MSYCVNCGVELEKSEKYCPLCKTEVINPGDPWMDKLERPYPKQIETIARHIDRSFFGILASLILLIPILITVLCDLLITHAVTWSGYVIGAILLIFVWFVVPFFFKKPHPLTFAVVDCAALIIFVWLVEAVSKTHWFLSLGLPITLSVSAIVILLTWIFTRKKKVPMLSKVAIILFATGILCVLIELFIALAMGMPLKFIWSLFCLVPCAILGIAALVLQKRQNLREQIRRRLFI